MTQQALPLWDEPCLNPRWVEWKRAQFFLWLGRVAKRFCSRNEEEEFKAAEAFECGIIAG